MPWRECSGNSVLPISIVNYSLNPGHSRASTIPSQMGDYITGKNLNLLTREVTSYQGATAQLSRMMELTLFGRSTQGSSQGLSHCPRSRFLTSTGAANPRLFMWTASERGLSPQIPLRRLMFRALNRGRRSHRETPEPSPIRSPLSYGCSRIIGDCGWHVSVHIKELMGRGARKNPRALAAPQGCQGRYTSSTATSGRCGFFTGCWSTFIRQGGKSGPMAGRPRRHWVGV